MVKKSLFLLLATFILYKPLSAKELPFKAELLIGQQKFFCQQILLIEANDTLRKKKIITAFCAFPFPLGVVGGHRVLLGTKPWVPIVYVATVGGCFGLIPLIDFVVIVSRKDISIYENNPGVFMWLK
mgnify:CR=1 FL=1